MKRRIEELMNGIYEYKTPDLLFSCDEIRAVVKPGEKFFGSFTIKNKEQKRIRGFLYSSDARVACEPREFSGIEPKLSFDVHLRWILLHSWQRSITRKRMRCSAPGVLQGRSKSSIRSLRLSTAD